MTKSGILTGYSLSVRQLSLSDVKLFSVDLGDTPIEHCVAVFGEDLGECLFAVVHLSPDPNEPDKVLWSDIDGSGTPIPLESNHDLAKAISTVLYWTFPHLR